MCIRDRFGVARALLIILITFFGIFIGAKSINFRLFENKKTEVQKTSFILPENTIFFAQNISENKTFLYKICEEYFLFDAFSQNKEEFFGVLDNGRAFVLFKNKPPYSLSEYDFSKFNISTNEAISKVFSIEKKSSILFLGEGKINSLQEFKISGESSGFLIPKGFLWKYFPDIEFETSKISLGDLSEIRSDNDSVFISGFLKLNKKLPNLSKPNKVILRESRDKKSLKIEIQDNIIFEYLIEFFQRNENLRLKYLKGIWFNQNRINLLNELSKIEVSDLEKEWIKISLFFNKQASLDKESEIFFFNLFQNIFEAKNVEKRILPDGTAYEVFYLEKNPDKLCNETLCLKSKNKKEITLQLKNDRIKDLLNTKKNNKNSSILLKDFEIFLDKEKISVQITI